jgi:hypothetical protein
MGITVVRTHPRTVVLFEGFRLAHWPAVRELVVRAASLLPLIRTVGWAVVVGRPAPGGIGYRLGLLVAAPPRGGVTLVRTPGRGAAPPGERPITASGRGVSRRADTAGREPLSFRVPGLCSAWCC